MVQRLIYTRELHPLKRIDYYVASTIAMTMALTVIGLLGILSIFTLLNEIEAIRNNYTMSNVFLFVLFSLPRLFCDVIPYAALIGCLVGLGILASNSELVVMRASGVSTWAITWSAMKPTLVLVFSGLYVGEYVLPDVEQTARINRERAMSIENKVTSEFGFWYREGDVYMHFDDVNRSGVLERISQYAYDDENRLTRSLFAERGVYHDVREGEKYWLLESVAITELEGDFTRTEHLSSMRWDTELSPELLSTEILVKPDRMSIGELSAKINYMQAQGLNSGKFKLGFWRKVLQPVATIALVFVAISFVFGPLREATMGMRVVAGLIIGLIFKFIHDLLSPASMVFGFAPIIAILIPIVLCVGVGYILLRRAG